MSVSNKVSTVRNLTDTVEVTRFDLQSPQMERSGSSKRPAVWWLMWP